MQNIFDGEPRQSQEPTHKADTLKHNDNQP